MADAYVWVWLPGKTDPVVAGRLVAAGGGRHVFNYGRSFLGRSDAIPLYLPELPLRSGEIDPPPGLSIAGALRDAGPDYWGRRVLARRILGGIDRRTDLEQIDVLTYLLESGSNRFGALDFQASPDEYTARFGDLSLEELTGAAALVERGEPLPAGIREVFAHGSGTLGGARPKAALIDGKRHYVAKFPSITDVGPVVKAEAAAFSLARRVGLHAPMSKIVHVKGRDVLLVERFDRGPEPGTRRMAVSALTLMQLDETWVREATYVQFAEIVRERFVSPAETLAELFRRIAFNICIGNNDDHARNHAAFWDGATLELTPVFDLEMRSLMNNDGRGEMHQAMAYGPNGERVSRLTDLVATASVYLLSQSEAHEIAQRCVDVIGREWNSAADEAGLTELERTQLWGTSVLRKFALDGFA